MISKGFYYLVNIHKISMRIYESDYHLFLENVEMGDVYVFDPNKIDWKKTFIDPELIREENKINKKNLGGSEFESDPFKFNRNGWIFKNN